MNKMDISVNDAMTHIHDAIEQKTAQWIIAAEYLLPKLREAILKYLHDNNNHVVETIFSSQTDEINVVTDISSEILDGLAIKDVIELEKELHKLYSVRLSIRANLQKMIVLNFHIY